MNDKPSNRQTERIQKALKTAFVQLMRESSYEAITVGEIAACADVGRSTFYHHYESKADILLGWHEDIFGMLRIGHYTADDWLGDAPPPQFIAFFEQMLHSRMPLADLGKDVTFVLRGIGNILTGQIEGSLSLSFPDIQTTMPLPVLAQSIAGIYVWLFFWWVMGRPAYSPEEMAVYAHQMVRGAVRTAGIGEGR